MARQKQTEPPDFLNPAAGRVRAPKSSPGPKPYPKSSTGAEPYPLNLFEVKGKLYICPAGYSESDSEGNDVELLGNLQSLSARIKLLEDKLVELHQAAGIEEPEEEELSEPEEEGPEKLEEPEEEEGGLLS